MNTLSQSPRSRSSRRKTLLAAPTLLFAATMGQRTAQALPHFPHDIAAAVQSDTEPACSICHLGGKIGGITTVTPFALALKSRGFDGETVSLFPALARLEADRTDTDGDGVTDVDELRAGMDPNSPVPLAPSADPSFGCALAPGTSGEGPVRLVAAGALMLVLSRLTRRRRPSSPR